MEIEFKDIVRSYYKAKVDLYYSNDDRADDLVDYEIALDENLTLLHENLLRILQTPEPDSEQISGFSDDHFLGTAHLMAKGADPADPTPRNQAPGKLIRSDAWAQSETEIEESGLNIDFRLLSKCSIDMHIVSTLWIELVGDHIDQTLGIEQPPNVDKFCNEQNSSAYGNRLRRTRAGEYNQAAPGTTKPYLYQYERWQRNGYKAISDGLERGDEIVVLTADIKSFFPSLDPSFLTHNDYIKYSKLDSLNETAQRLNRLFIKILQLWKHRISQLTGLPGSCVGLPLGLAASGIIANGALAQFDKTIREQVNPLYYGRYVDDITVVLKGSESLRTAHDVVRWVAARTVIEDQDAPLLVLSETAGDHTGLPDLILRLTYLQDSEIVFSHAKTRVHIFNGTPGEILLQTLKKQDAERASEWRELPILPSEPLSVGRQFVSLIDSEGADASSLSAASISTSKRADFALKLRNVEAYSRDLNPEGWQEHRKEFYKTVREFIFPPTNFLKFERYLPRILNVALASQDWDQLELLVKDLFRMFSQISAGASVNRVQVSVNGTVLPEDTKFSALVLWHTRLRMLVTRTVTRDAQHGISKELGQRLANYTTVGSLNEHATASWTPLVQAAAGDLTLSEGIPQSTYNRFFFSDLAATPLRAWALPSAWQNWSLPANVSTEERSSARISVDEEASARIEAFKVFFLSDSNELSNTNAIFGMAFPTRPASTSELFAATRMLDAKPLVSKSGNTAGQNHLGSLNKFLKALRGYSLDEPTIPTITPTDSPSAPFTLSVGATATSLPQAQDRDDSYVDIAVGMIETTRDQLSKSIHGEPDLGIRRYNSLIALTNRVISHEVRPHYLVLPELSVPTRWFFRIANKLAAVNISLITGVEYQIDKDDEFVVQNQVWASLTTLDWGFPSNVVYIQDKIRPAHGEEINLLEEAKKRLVPKIEWNPIPVIDHGGFKFSLLICSELTNIQYRASARGRIDALIVPEWNQDTETFSSIVESSAYDVHCFVVQANNRPYGDSRIRGPYKQRYARDVVRISGGISDQIVIGRLSYSELRRFQSRHSLNKNARFKPLPDGYDIEKTRRLL